MANKDVILALGAPPKLGQKQGGYGRAQTSKAYKGSMLPDLDGPDEEDDEMQDDHDQEPDDMLVGAAQDVMAAFHSANRDPARFAEALQSFVQMCS